MRRDHNAIVSARTNGQRVSSLRFGPHSPYPVNGVPSDREAEHGRLTGKVQRGKHGADYRVTDLTDAARKPFESL